MPEGIRVAKVSARILRIVAEIVSGKIPDRHLELVTITDVRVTGDLKKAVIFYTVYGSAEQKSAADCALADNVVVIRSMLARSLGIKFVPALEFVRDKLANTSQRIEQLLLLAAERDEGLREMQASREYAAGEDAYREL